MASVVSIVVIESVTVFAVNDVLDFLFVITFVIVVVEDEVGINVVEVDDDFSAIVDFEVCILVNVVVDDGIVLEVVFDIGELDEVVGILVLDLEVAFAVKEVFVVIDKDVVLGVSIGVGVIVVVEEVVSGTKVVKT